MFEERRHFLKTTLRAGALGVGTVLAAKCSVAGEKEAIVEDSNGVVTGKSPKKEILYKKTEHWDAYYKAVC